MLAVLEQQNSVSMNSIKQILRRQQGHPTNAMLFYFTNSFATLSRNFIHQYQRNFIHEYQEILSFND